MSKGFALVFVLVLIVSSVITFLPVKAQYQGDITINADGTVSPSTAPIQHAGNIYLLTSTVNGSISVSRSNAVFGGQGYTLFGEVFLRSVSNVTIENFSIVGNGGLQTEQVGISLTGTSDVVIANNTITGMGSLLAMNAQGLYAGIYVDDGSSNVISGNNLIGNIDSMYFYNTENNYVVGNNLTDISNPWGINGSGIFLITLRTTRFIITTLTILLENRLVVLIQLTSGITAIQAAETIGVTIYQDTLVLSRSAIPK